MKHALLLTSLFAFTSFAQAATAPFARIIELSSHRIEKLVNLKKIDASFMSKLHTIEVEKLADAGAGEPQFVSTVSQFAGADGTKNQIELLLDAQGKALSFKVKSGADAQNAPVWPDKEATTLIENGLHYLLDHGHHLADLKPFYDSALSLTLKKGVLNGVPHAQVEVTSKDTQRVLSLFVKFDGTFVKYEVQ